MSDEPKNVPDGGNTGNPDGGGNQPETVPLPTFLEMKHENKELKQRLDEIERNQEEAKRKDLEEKEQYKELYEKAQAERDAFKTDFDKAAERLSAIDAAQREQNQKKVSGEQWEKIKDWPLEQQTICVNEVETRKAAGDPGRGRRTLGDDYSQLSFGELGKLIQQGDSKAREEYLKRTAVAR